MWPLGTGTEHRRAERARRMVLLMAVTIVAVSERIVVLVALSATPSLVALNSHEQRTPGRTPPMSLQ